MRVARGGALSPALARCEGRNVGNRIRILKRQSDADSSRWQAAIHRHNFQVTLAPEFDPIKDSGFVPALYRDREAGFEFYLERLDLSTVGERPPEAAQMDRQAVFVTHSNMAEGISSWIAAGVLAAITHGVLRDDQSGEILPGAAAMAWSRVAELEAEVQ